MAVCPGFNVTGVVIPVAPNREPATERDEIVTGAVPEEVRVTDFVASAPTFTLPNATDVALRVSAGTPLGVADAEAAAAAVRTRRKIRTFPRLARVV